jgi:hypothetical protein
MFQLFCWLVGDGEIGFAIITDKSETVDEVVFQC